MPKKIVYRKRREAHIQKKAKADNGNVKVTLFKVVAYTLRLVFAIASLSAFTVFPLWYATK